MYCFYFLSIPTALINLSYPILSYPSRIGKDILKKIEFIELLLIVLF